MEKFASYAKSTVSLEDDACSREGCIEARQKLQRLLGGTSSEQMRSNAMDCTAEVDRQSRKIAILQKSKELLSEELGLVKEELQSVKLKLKKSEEKISYSLSTPREHSARASTIDFGIVMREKEEQLQMLCGQLKKKEREVVGLRLENSQLKEQGQSRQALLDKIQASSQTQIDYYRKQVQDYEQELADKDKEIIEGGKLNANLMKREVSKWEMAVSNYNGRMQALESEIEKFRETEKNMVSAIKKLREEKAALIDQLEGAQEKAGWLEKLLEETKIEFMHAELKRLEKKDKMGKEKTGIKPKHSIQNKSCRSISSVSTALTSAKNRPNAHSNCSTVAPFRVSPHESLLFEPDWPNLLEASSNQL